jgi:hypothetical protein
MVTVVLCAGLADVPTVAADSTPDLYLRSAWDL